MSDWVDHLFKCSFLFMLLQIKNEASTPTAKIWFLILVNSRKNPSRDWGYGISRGVKEIASGTNFFFFFFWDQVKTIWSFAPLFSGIARWKYGINCYTLRIHFTQMQSKSYTSATYYKTIFCHRVVLLMCN